MIHAFAMRAPQRRDQAAPRKHRTMPREPFGSPAQAADESDGGNVTASMRLPSGSTMNAA